MSRKRMLDICIFLTIAIFAVLLYKLSPRPEGVMANATVLPTSTCSPAQTVCTISLPNGGQLEFSIEPKPVQPLQMLTLSVKTRDMVVDKIEVDFAGKDMNMGINRPTLKATGNGFSGQTSLPVCITGKMSWLVTVLVHSGTERFHLPFMIETGT